MWESRRNRQIFSMSMNAKIKDGCVLWGGVRVGVTRTKTRTRTWNCRTESKKGDHEPWILDGRRTDKCCRGQMFSVRVALSSSSCANLIQLSVMQSNVKQMDDKQAKQKREREEEIGAGYWKGNVAGQRQWLGLLSKGGKWRGEAAYFTFTLDH